MPHLTVNGTTYFYTVEGEGPETLVLGHGLLLTHRLWDAQVAALRDRYRCVRFDWRGQGRSAVPPLGYDPWVLAADVLRLADALGTRRFHYAGHGMGGHVGLRVALRAPERVATLVLVGSGAAAASDAERACARLIGLGARTLGLRAVLPRLAPYYFGPRLRKDAARHADHAAARRLLTSSTRTGALRATRALLARDDLRGRLRALAQPVLILAGELDALHPPAEARGLAARLPHAELTVLSETGHTPPLERPQTTSRLLTDFLGRRPIR
ncbi:MAG: alpha/beta fold hydrolase [Rubricoccaceae bacterium]